MYEGSQAIEIVERFDRTFGSQHLVGEALKATVNRFLFVETIQKL